MSRAIEETKSPEEKDLEEMSDGEFIDSLCSAKVSMKDLMKGNESEKNNEKNDEFVNKVEKQKATTNEFMKELEMKKKRMLERMVERNNEKNDEKNDDSSDEQTKSPKTLYDEAADFIDDSSDDSDDDSSDDLLDHDTYKALIKELDNPKLKRYSLKQRINDHVCDLFDYEKFVKNTKPKNPQATGQLLKINQIPSLAIIDIDISKELNEDERDKVRNDIIKRLEIDDLTKNEWFIVKTTSGGLHIYANIDGFNLGYNRNIKCYESDEFDVDIFGCVDYNKTANVCRYGTKALNKHNEVGVYEVIYGSDENRIVKGVEDVLDLLDITDDVKDFIHERIKGDEAKEIRRIEMELLPNEFKQQELTVELFNAIVGGFLKQNFKTQIHNYSNRLITERVGILQLMTGLCACRNDNISDEMIKAAINKIYCRGTLTEKAQQNLDTSDIYKYANNGWSYRCLITMLKTFASSYYEKHVKPLVVIEKSSEKFINDKYNLNNFIHDVGYITCVKELLEKMNRFIAFCGNGRYIIKERSEANNDKDTNNENEMVEFNLIRSSELKEKIGNIEVSLPTTEEEKQKMRNDKKKVKDIKKLKISKLLQDSSVYKYFHIYDGISLLTESKNILQLYVPPNGKYDEKLINDWLEFMSSLIESKEAFNEFLDSHAYRFRHPSEFIEKFFINFGSGNNGKSYLAACISEIYPNVSNVGVNLKQITSDMFNSWMTRNLFLWMEEVEDETYRTKDLQKNVKLMTTKNASSRGMYLEVKSARNWAICGMNTNNEDLYGLIRGDKALKDRLVIMKFNEGNADKYGGKKKFDIKCKSFIKNPNFAYSLYHYLKEVRVINERFSPVRYEGKDKYDFIEKAQMSRKNSVEEWITDVMSRKGFKKRSFRKVPFMLVNESDANADYKTWCSYDKSRIYMKSIKETMINLGFEYLKTRIDGEQLRIYRMEESKYNELMNKLNECDDNDKIEEADPIDGEEGIDTDAL